MAEVRYKSGNSELLFFILVFLLLFYDDSYLELRSKIYGYKAAEHDSSILFFILIFLLLFY